MDRLHKILVLLLVAAIPAGAPSYFASSNAACFTSGSITYRMVQDATAPDYRVRIDDGTANPSLRLRLADRAENADFVLVDDVPGKSASSCQTAAGAIRTIKIVRNEPADLTVSLSGEGDAEHTIYVHSARFGHADGAALFAVLQYADTLARSLHDTESRQNLR
jgi:hypothetical protein